MNIVERAKQEGPVTFGDLNLAEYYIRPGYSKWLFCKKTESSSFRIDENGIYTFHDIDPKAEVIRVKVLEVTVQKVDA